MAHSAKLMGNGSNSTDMLQKVLYLWKIKLEPSTRWIFIMINIHISTGFKEINKIFNPGVVRWIFSYVVGKMSQICDADFAVKIK